MKIKNKLLSILSLSVFIGIALISCDLEKNKNNIDTTLFEDFDGLLNTLTSTDFAQVGTLNIYQGTNPNAYNTTKIDIKSVWCGDYFFLEQTYNNEDGTIDTSTINVYKNNEGLAVTRTLISDNTYIDDPILNDEGESIYFDEKYNNPFSNLTVNDFIQLIHIDFDVEPEETENFYILLYIDNEYSLNFGFFLTGIENVSLDDIDFTIDENNNISGSTSFYEEYIEDEVTMYLKGSYEFELVSQDTIDYEKLL